MKNITQYKPVLVIIALVVVGVLATLVFVPMQPRQQSSPAQTTDKKNVKQKTSLTEKISLKFVEKDVQNGKVVGELVIENKTYEPLTNLYYNLHLQKPDKYELVKNGDKSVLSVSEGASIAYNEVKVGTLNSKEKKTFPVTFYFPVDIDNGQYYLRSFLISSNGDPLAADLTKVNLWGNGEVITLKDGSCQLIAEGQTFGVNDGPNVNPGGFVDAKCTFTNALKKSITVYPLINHAIRYVTGFPTSEKKSSVGSAITFAAGETKDVTVRLPQETTPQVYQAYISLITDKQQQVSVNTVYRWIVRGQSAYIQESLPDKDLYTKGDTANIQVLAAPSMDLYWRNNPRYKAVQGTVLKNARLLVQITSNTTECGRTEINLPEGNSSNSWTQGGINPLKAAIKIQTDCKNPKIATQVLEGNQKLASYERQVLSASAIRINKPILLVIIGTVLVCGLVAFVMSRHMKNKTVKTTILGLFTVFAFAGYSLFFFFMNIHQLNAQSFTGFSVSPPGQGISLYISNGHNSMRGTFWLDGSTAEQKGSDRFRFHFFGSKSNDICGNGNNGYRISPLIGDATTSDGSFTTTNMYIEGANGENIALPNNVQIESYNSVNNPYMSFDFTVVKSGGFDRNTDKTVRLDVDGMVVTKVDGVNYNSYSRQSQGRSPYSGAELIQDSSCNCIGRVEFPIDYSPVSEKTNISGRVVDVDENKGVAGVAIETCGLTNQTTDANGYFTIPNIDQGTGFCIRITTPSGYTNQTGSYEWQAAKKLDLSKTDSAGVVHDKVQDDAFDFSLTKNANQTVCAPAGNVKLRWNAVPGANSYQVTFNGTTYTTTGTCKQVNVTNGQTYSWSAKANVSGSLCAAQASSQFTVDCNVPTPTPTTGTTPRPQLGDLQITEGTGGVRGGTGGAPGRYGTSGLRPEDGGTGVFNTLKIIPKITLPPDGVTLNDIQFVAAAFTASGQQAPQRDRTSDNGASIKDLLDSARLGNGFVVVYARCPSVPCVIEGYTLRQGVSYIYYAKNTTNHAAAENWKSLDTTPQIITNANGDTIFRALPADNSATPLQPSFEVQIRPGAQNRRWGTYSFVQTTSGYQVYAARTPTISDVSTPAPRVTSGLSVQSTDTCE